MTPVSSNIYQCISRTGYTCLDSLRRCPGPMTDLNAKQELDIPFSKIDEWEAKLKDGVCAAFWEAANWGYQKRLSENPSREQDYSNSR